MSSSAPEASQWTDALKEILPERLPDINAKAFEAGRFAVTIQPGFQEGYFQPGIRDHPACISVIIAASDIAMVRKARHRQPIRKIGAIFRNASPTKSPAGDKTAF